MAVTTNLRADPKLSLAVEILRSGGSIRLQALGASMLPTIWPGDILIIESSLGTEMTAGDIVLIATDSTFVVHRLVQNFNSHCITRGDCMPQNDPPVAAAELIGRVSAIHRRHRIVIPQLRTSLTARALAWMLCRWDLLRNGTLRMHSFWQNRASFSPLWGKAGRSRIGRIMSAPAGVRHE